MTVSAADARRIINTGQLAAGDRARLERNVALLDASTVLSKPEAAWMELQLERFRSEWQGMLPVETAEPDLAGRRGDAERAMRSGPRLGYGDGVFSEAPSVSPARLVEVKGIQADPLMQARYHRVNGSVEARRGVEQELKKLGAYDEFTKSELLDPVQKERVLRVAAFAVEFTTSVSDNAQFQHSNALHLVDELSIMTDVAKQLGLSKRQAENAYLASLFSDCDKVPGGLSLVTHHEAGARAAAVRLQAEFPGDPKRVAEIVEMVKAHQVAPPRFMALMLGLEIRRLGPLSPVEESALASAQAKISDPLDPKNLNPARTGILFTDVEKRVLGRIGLHEWAVPSSPQAWAVVLSDAKSNYGKPPHKIYGNCGPGTSFRHRTSEEALANVLGPKGTGWDAGRLLPEALQPGYEASLNAARAGVERARVKMDAWLVGHGLDPQHTPYWRDTPLVYPEDGGSPADFELATKVRDQFEIFLREEAGA